MFLLCVQNPRGGKIGKFRIRGDTIAQNLLEEVKKAMGASDIDVITTIGDVNVGIDEVVRAVNEFDNEDKRDGFQGLEAGIDFDGRLIHMKAVKCPKSKGKKRSMANEGGENLLPKMRECAKAAISKFCSRRVELSVTKKTCIGDDVDLDWLIVKNLDFEREEVQGGIAVKEDEVLVRTFPFALPKDGSDFWERGFQAAVAETYVKVAGGVALETIRQYITNRIYGLNHELKTNTLHQSKCSGAWIKRQEFFFHSYKKWYETYVEMGSGQNINSETCEIESLIAEQNLLLEHSHASQRQRLQGETEEKVLFAGGDFVCNPHI